MIKTTNYEISKKLAEIGFRAECSYFYFHSDNNCKEKTLYNLEEFGFDKIDDCDIEDKYYPAYDLETLLSALPDTIGGCLMIHKEGMYYQESMIEVQKQKNESLADTAGRMIIELHENNLIKF
jgi:hypothetical protein